MKKYIIFAVPRTGSTLYDLLLNRYYEAITGNKKNSEYTGGDTSIIPQWNNLLHHTHQIDLLQNAPNDYVKIITTRSLLDSVVSLCVAQITDQWHMITDTDINDYLDDIKNRKKITIDITNFKELVAYSDYHYCRAYKILNEWSGEKYILNYNKHTDPTNNFQTFYNELGINQSETPVMVMPKVVSKAQLKKQYWVNAKMPVDKFLMIENLQEVLDAYKSCHVIHNFDDDITISHVENILKEK